MSDLIGIQPIIDIIALALQSAFVQNEKNGVSVLLVSKPETAKTSSIFKFYDLGFVAYYDEITQKKMIDEFLPLCKTRERRTLLIPDLINCIDKQKSTRDQFLAMIKSGIDDTGIIRISTYHKQLQYLKLIEGIKFNLITALTAKNYYFIEKKMKGTGLLSRFLPFTYSYPSTLLIDLFDHIEGKNVGGGVTIPKIVQEDKIIENEPSLFKKFEQISIRLGHYQEAYGLRVQKSLQRLAKANAILRGSNKVEEVDIKKVISLSNWINYDFNVLVS